MLRLRSRNPYVVTFMLAVFGIGVLSWYGWDLYALPRYSEQDIQSSVETNLILDLSRLPAEQRPRDLATVEKLRKQLRTEIDEQIAMERREPEQGVMAGLICLLLALGHGLVQWYLQRNSGGP